MDNTCIAVLVTAVSFMASALAFPAVLRFARAHGIVDNPNARKLQRIPVPVLGGAVVYTGILAGGLVLTLFMKDSVLLWGFLGMTLMMVIGTWDDMRDLSATLRFVIEIGLVGAFIALTDVYIDDLHGLWGIHQVEPVVGIPLSVVAGVGLINAVNLIDGVDGYSSGYGMMACGMFALVFWNVWAPEMVCLALIVMGALMPFFLHNVFGLRSKMFIGDGGTLMLGMLMTVFVFFSLSSHTRCDQLSEKGLSLTALTLAIMCIPVFDTLRVMLMRILRGTSPFHPDKTHLHHLFIDMGFSHLGAALSILLVNALVIAVWWVLWQLGVGVDWQTYAVGFMGVAVTFGFYKLMKVQQNGGPVDEEGYPQGTPLWHLFCRVGEWSHFEKGRFWRFMTRLMDSRLIGHVLQYRMS